MPHPFAVQVCLVVWKDLVVYRLRRERLLSLIELSAPVVLLALFWLSFAAHPDTHGAAWLDAGLPGPRRDPCDAPYAADRIAFAPADSPYARELMLRAFPALAKNEGLSGFSSKQEILDKASDGSLGSDVAVIFDGMEEASKPNEETPNAPGDLNYTLLFGEALPPEKFMFRCQGPRAIDDAQEELLARTLWPVQCRLNRAHLSLYAETRNINPPPPVLKVRMKRFPLPAMETDVGPCQPLLPWVAVFMFQVGFLPLCLNDLYRIIDDKVNDKREWMMIQGLRNGAYLWGQGVAQFIVASLPCLATVSVLAWPHHSVLFTAFSYSEPTALFTALFLLYAAKLAASCLLFGTVFMSRWMCTRSFTLWWLVTAALGLAFELDTSDTWAWLLCLFLPNLSLTLGLRSVWDAERQGVGLSWGRLDLQGGWLVALMSALSLLMLVTLVWYLDATLPYPDRMRRQPFHFLFQDDFWQLSSKAADRYKAPDGHCCNPAGEPAVTVLDVRKHVGNIQMDHLSIDFICNRITVIFGHSGSGKSTLVKMICGIQAPDEGSIYVHDVNVQHNLSEARSLMSYCAEKSTLYEFMTVKEHIGYSKLLNASSQTPAAWREVDTDDLLYRLRLSDYTDSLISKLAYGVQRKVAVAVALSRPAEVLVLDEPTSGMDAVSQADVWKVLWLMRRTSTIIMTSNKSAEVDVLADRAVILARGVVQLNNEVAYLRENLRLGYRICLQLLPYASSALIRNRLQLLNPEYRVLSEIGLEMMIYLPNTDQARAREIALQLRAQKRALKLSHVGAPYRTIEDAVMRIWNRVHQPSYAASPSSDFDVTALSQHQNRVSNLSTWWSARRRFSALSLKNMLLFRAHVSKFGRDAITCGALFFLLHLFLVGRAPSLGAHAASGSLVKLDARSVGLGAFVRDWPASPVFAGIVLRSLLEESGVKHLLPLQEEPGEFLRSLPVAEWRRQGLGIELHAANAAPGASSWVTLWWSGERWASSGAALTLLHAAQLANVSRVAGARIRARAGPLPRARWAASVEQVLERAFNDVHAFGAVLVLSVLLASLTVSLGALARSEALSGLELLQAMTGLGGCWYWLSHFLWDFIAPYLTFYVPALAPAFVYIFFGRGALFLATSLALFLIYGLALIPVVHLIGKLFPFRSQVTVTFLSIVFSVGPTVLELIWDAEGPSAAPMGRSITAASRVVPSAALSSGLVRLLRLQALGQLCELPLENRTGLCDQLRQRLLFSPTALDSLAVCCDHDIGKPVPGFSDLLLGDTHFALDVLALLLVGINVLLLLAVSASVLAPIWHFVTHRACHSFWGRSAIELKSVTPGGEGSGLMSPSSPIPLRRAPSSSAPATRNASPMPGGSRGSKSPLVQEKSVVMEARDLCCTFGSVVAVRGVWLHVREGECVGLLGQSGSGKSTTLRMLSGELQPTEGIKIVHAPDSESATLIGYQPSTAGCSPDLTARQHLRLLAALRLLPDTENLVYHLLRLMDLEKEGDMPTRHYCRASLRKLGLAMALLGAPRLVLLDAPTSGVDPISARKMWQALNAFIVANNQAVVLATTQIPECLALCSDTVVLSQGKPTWMGRVPDLRNTFFMGMVITVTLSDEEEPDVIAQFQRNVREIFEGEAHMVTMHKNVLRFKIGDPLYPLASLKAKMNEVFQLNIVREVDFGPVALHKLFGIKEPEF